MTISSIFVPDWITYTTSSSNPSHTFTKVIGLHRSCESEHGCQHFPTLEDCSGTDRYFCSMWRSVGFLMSFAAVLELATIVAYMVVINGSKQKRETGWKVLAFLLVLVGVVQCGAMAIVVCSPLFCGVDMMDIVSPHLWGLRANDGGYRHTSLITTIAFLSGGSWIRVGFFALLVGVLPLCLRRSSPSPHSYSRKKEIMNLFLVRVDDIDENLLRRVFW